MWQQMLSEHCTKISDVEYSQAYEVQRMSCCSMKCKPYEIELVDRRNDIHGQTFTRGLQHSAVGQ